MPRIRIFDATLRDGSHAMRHQFTAANIEDYCQMIDSSGVYAVIVGHGNGLGASSLQVGISLTADKDMLATARRELHHAKLGAYMIPGFGTIHDDIMPAIKAGVEVFKIGCHCTEADTTKEHIQYIREQGKEVYGVLMMSHTASAERLASEARKMQDYGAAGVILMDSAGAFTPEMVKRAVSALSDALDVRVGFHAHNNLGLAIANSYTAIKCGAAIIDGTVRGFGAGAGNCQIEGLAALLKKEDADTGINLYALMDASEKLVKGWAMGALGRDCGVDSISIVNALAGVFSGFKVHVMKAAEQFNVDARDILMELGRRHAVAGQEDMAIQVARDLSGKVKADESYFVSSLL